MFGKVPIKKVSQPVLDSEKLQSSPSTLDIVVLQKFAVALDECNEESLLGGCFSCEQSGIKYSYIVRWNVSNSTQRS
ncbi:MAG: hypothetical protein Fur006_47500 [Coleofasciculaceae cyanobacterium]